ncbi:unnamed protein product [Zymoseptoria tritici ST99CH_1E4]|uniref:Store-operated calcium entry-associated regulatory factor n=1 Tax=Zymoseptoria tritici ST99CH_1E4 TaxID=1276532 RepID=A0A2H1GTN7_ZYMTR|nr:unnamed protein product [Zymoseptoria tritici ST99CH_1E4]
MRLPFFLLTTTLLTTPSVLALGGSSKILLSKVKSLTLRSSALTTSRRVPPVPQLTCVGGNAQGLYDVDVMSCKNNGQGYDSEDIHWVCQASLPPEFKLGATDVVCEGYDSAEDPWVLKGSCAVEYRLVLTPLGEEKYKSHLGSSWRSPSSSYHSPSSSSGGLSDSISTFIFWLFFLGVAGLIIYSVCVNPNNPNRRGGRFGNRNNWGGWGGGGGGGGPDDGTDDPPPPYTPRGPKVRFSPYGSSSAGGANSGPGFWTGTMAGAAAGYGAAAWNARRNQQQQQQAGPSSWFGGGGNAGGQGYGVAGPSNYASAPAPSSSRHESTGFGGTRRR